MEPHTSYLICATPRSGSTLLCEALENTGLPRHPKEYFETLGNRAVLDLLGDYSRLDDEYGEPTLWDGADYANYLMWVRQAGTTPNGVFGAKMMWGYFGDFIDNARQIPAYREMAVPDILTSNFPN